MLGIEHLLQRLYPRPAAELAPWLIFVRRLGLLALLTQVCMPLLIFSGFALVTVAGSVLCLVGVLVHAALAIQSTEPRLTQLRVAFFPYNFGIKFVIGFTLLLCAFALASWLA